MKIIKKAIYSVVDHYLLNGASDYNSLQLRRSCRTKKQARDMFEKHNIPHAKGEIFFNPYTAYKFVKKHGFPVVLKPNVGGYSRGSYFPIMTWSEFWKAMFLVKLWFPTTVIEQYLLGHNYRVVVSKGSIDLLNERTPAIIIGNGKSSISQLIEEENEIRTKMGILKEMNLIKHSGKVRRHLKKQGYTFSSILEEGKQIYLFHRVSLAPGGVLENIDVDTMTQKNKKICIEILDLFQANVFGIDVIMEEGMHIDYDKQKTIFLEVNSRASLEMHNYPRYGKKPNLEPLFKKLDKIEIKDRGIF
ncbi:cyanophycin synthetase [Candidatus Gracilibacteria bacterium]|nr:cyanophycin synthetase [Candidatus Gracilibacteria bacterium]